MLVIRSSSTYMAQESTILVDLFLSFVRSTNHERVERKQKRCRNVERRDRLRTGRKRRDVLQIKLFYKLRTVGEEIVYADDSTFRPGPLLFRSGQPVAPRKSLVQWMAD